MALSYRWSDVRKDLVAGLTVAAIAVPQAMAYSLIAGIDPRFGLYSAVVVTAIASVFGSSSHLINGPTNAISLVVFSALALLGPETRSALFQATFLLAAMVGLIQILVAVLKLGDLTRYISESVILGFMTGAGFLIALTQVGNLLGLEDRGTGYQHILVRLWLTVTSGGTINPRSVVVSLTTVILVLGLRRLSRKYRLPRLDMLMALVVVAVLAATLGWSHPGVGGKPAVAVVGDIPAGLPAPHVPEFKVLWVQKMAPSALAIACLGLLEALAISKSIAHRTREPLDYNRQCLAEGLANLGGSFFQCLPGSGSLTRSAINFQAGAVSRWSGVFAAVAVAIVIVLFGPSARFIPKPALAGILLVTAAGLIDWQRLRYALHASRYDAGLVLVTALAAVFVSVELSILIGVALSIVMFVPRASRITASELTVGGDRFLRDRQPDDPRCNRMIILDLEGQLFFGAAPDLDRYFDELRQKIDAGVRIIILRVKRTQNPDMVCMERFQHFLRDMEQKAVTVLLCGVRVDFDQAMKNLHFHDWLPRERIFRENAGLPGSATAAAVRYAYDLLGDDMCDTCPRRKPAEPENGAIHYVI
ncbi:MAG: SulP family inorganic anion transporter [Thermoguttaceae bacterium]